jgi:VWFA-related protein
MFTIACLTTTLAICSAAVMAQAPAATQEQTPPVFRSEVETVEVDAIVTDKDGKFVRTLTRDDFEVYQDGKKQPVALVNLIEHPIPTTLTPPETLPADPDVATNAGANEGRIYVLVLDGLHITERNRLKVVSAARLFVEQYLGDTDMMAVLHIGGTAPYSQDVTRSRARLLASIDKFRASNMLPSESRTISETSQGTQISVTNDDGSTTTTSLIVADLFENERALQTTQTLSALEQISNRLGTIRGRRKALIFISEGFTSPQGTSTQSIDAVDQINASRSRALADQIERSLQDATRAAALGDVTIYSVDPRGLRVGGDAELLTSNEVIMQTQEDARSVQSMRDVAALTGGTAIVNTNNIAAGLKRMVVENSGYYIVAFTPSPLPRDGKLHRLEVRVRQKGLNVKSRRGYVAASSAPAVVPNPKSGMSAATYEAMRRPVPTTGLNMSIFAAAFRKDATNTKVASVLIGTELQGRELNLANNAPLELQFALIDNLGKVRASRALNLSANLRAETRTRAEENGLRVLQRLEVPPGRYQLRVAANQPGSATGSVVHDIDVPDFGVTLGVSSVVLTSRAAAAAATIVSDPDLRTALPAPPGATRVFAQDDVVTVLAEVYDNRDTKGELLARVTINAPSGDVVRQVPAMKQSDDGPGYTATLPMEGLAPGKYVLVVDARASENAPPVIAPPVPFTVK